MNKWFAGCDNVKLCELHKNKDLIATLPEQTPDEYYVPM